MKKIFQLSLVSALLLGTAFAQTIRYVSPTGNDGNSGLDASHAWLSPNHSLTAPTVILAAAGAYNAANLYNMKWGQCTSTNGDICWLKCATAFTCTVYSASQQTTFLSASTWGIQGFKESGGSMSIAPSYADGKQVSNVVVANNIVGPCNQDGIGTNNGYGTSPTTGVDYVSYLGNIVFQTGGNSSSCAAGLSFYYPVLSDTLPGVHYYMGGNFSFLNTSNCGDGEGIIFDSFDGVEGGWPNQSQYSQVAVAENNLLVWNNGPGLQVDLNMNGSGPWSPVVFTHNTVAYNNQGPSQANYCAEIIVGTTKTATSTGNLVVAPTQYCFGSYTHYGTAAAFVNTTTDSVTNEFAYSPYGTGVGSIGSSGFTAGPNNITTTNPGLTNPAKPGVPNCSGYATTTACMAGLIANYTPTNTTAKLYGYKTPTAYRAYDPYFPSRLCQVTGIPAGLIQSACYPWVTP